jgi:hypothetical protein
MRLVAPPELPAECEPILRLPSRARPRLHPSPTQESAMIPDPKNEPAEEVEAEELDEQGQPKYGGGRRDHKPDHKPPGQQPGVDPQYGGGRRDAPAPEPKDVA